MAKKLLGITLIIAVLIGLGVGGYAVFHKSAKTSNANSYSYGNTTAATGSENATTNNATPVNNAVLITKTNSSVGGEYLASPSGMTLYTYSADSVDTSNCSGACLNLWPAYTDNGPTTGLPSGVGTIKRKDNGQIQYTFNGMPLYFYIGDKAPGQITGNGIQGFTVARP